MIRASTTKECSLCLVATRGGARITDGDFGVNPTRSRLMGTEARPPERRILGRWEGSS
jgi:hypothetical protein